MIYQTLQDLKDACTEAIYEGSPAIDFEVGVFSGKYTTPVSPAYFEHLSKLRGNKKRKAASMAQEGSKPQIITVASGGPVNGAPCYGKSDEEEEVEEEEEKQDKSLINQEDVR